MDEKPETTTETEHTIYLGDGVYLSNDSYQLWLSVGDHENKVVALDVDVFTNLMIYGLEFYKRYNKG